MADILETQRLRLRELTEADADHLIALNRNPKVVRYLSEGPLVDRAAALEILHGLIFPQYRNHGVGRWAVILKETGAFIGWCGLKALPEPNSYDLGYRYLETAWGKGLATEAALGVVAWARARLPGARLLGMAFADNQRSIRVLEKVGMRFDHRADEGGEPTNVYVLVSDPAKP